MEHEAGALNIDACRTSYRDEEDRQANLSRPGRGAGDGNHGADFPHLSEDWGAWEGGKGRWPTNALFLHRPGCRCVGIKKVSTGVAVRHNVGHSTKGNINYAQGSKDAEMKNDVTYGGTDGKEEIPEWECVEGCPVAALENEGREGVSRFFRIFF